MKKSACKWPYASRILQTETRKHQWNQQFCEILAGLKILVSAVQFRPQPPLAQRLTQIFFARKTQFESTKSPFFRNLGP